MGLRLLRRTKSLLVTFAVLSVCLYVLLSVLSEEFLMEEGQSSNPHHPRYETKQNKYHAGFMAQPQRKPKTMDLIESEEWAGSTFQQATYKRHNKLVMNSNLEGTAIVNNKYNIPAIPQSRSKYLHNNLAHSEFQEREVNNDNFDEQEDEQDEDGDEDDDDGEEDDNDDYGDVDNNNATNAPFRPGDFGDIRGLEFYHKPKLKYAEVSDDIAEHQSKEKGQTSRLALVENGVFWTEYVESLIPKGLSYANVTALLRLWRKQTVKVLEKPGWDRCGRPQNGYAVFGDGTRMCVRYRQPQASFVYGEALSFYLSRLLQMDNVPAVILAQISSTSRQWRAVNISSLAWKEDKTVAFIQWIDNINSGTSSKAYIPPIILQAYREGVPITSHVINKSLLFQRNPVHIAEVVQWGTMIVFDYLTGNYDRVASMQDAEDKEKDPKIMEEPIRNLRKSSQNGKLWLIDNESGLLDAYELLAPYQNKSRFSSFHRQMLETMCVFQTSLVNALFKLSEQSSPHQRLLKFSGSFEPLMSNVSVVEHFKLFIKMFDQRLVDVVNWIKYCQTMDAG